MPLALMVAGYVVVGFFFYPLWKSPDKWGIAAVLAPAHCVLFWYVTNAATDGRFIGAPVALIGGSVVTAFADGDFQVIAGLFTAFVVCAICGSGKDDKSSLL